MEESKHTSPLSFEGFEEYSVGLGVDPTRSAPFRMAIGHLLLKRLCQHCIGAYRLAHRDEVELNKIGDLVGHDDAFLALDSLLNPHLHVSSELL